jgi:hypothetical protein
MREICSSKAATSTRFEISTDRQHQCHLDDCEHSLYTSVLCGHPQPHPHIHAAEPLGDMTAVEGRGDRGDGCLMNVR